MSPDKSQIIFKFKLEHNIICCVKRKVRAKVFDELQALI